MATLVRPIDRPDIPPLEMSDRFRVEIAYFMSLPSDAGQPPLPAGSYCVRLDDARRCLDEGVFHLVSPLDSQNQTEIELSEEQEAWLEWMVKHGIERISLS